MSTQEYIYLYGMFPAFVVILVYHIMNDRHSYYSDTVLQVMISMLLAMCWPLVIVGVIGFGIAQLVIMLFTEWKYIYKWGAKKFRTAKYYCFTAPTKKVFR
jgi:hypothetical protein